MPCHMSHVTYIFTRYCNGRLFWHQYSGFQKLWGDTQTIHTDSNLMSLTSSYFSKQERQGNNTRTYLHSLYYGRSGRKEEGLFLRVLLTAYLFVYSALTYFVLCFVGEKLNTTIAAFIKWNAQYIGKTGRTFNMNIFTPSEATTAILDIQTA
jgi:hypothetical protein